MEDVVILTRLSLRGVSLFDLNKLSLADKQDVAELRRLNKLAQSGPRFTTQGVRKDVAANAKKTSFAIWIRFFFKDLQPARTVIPGVPRDFVGGPHYQQRLYMAGFFAFFLSYFVLLDYQADNPSPAVFSLAVLLACGEPIALTPLFLGSFHCQLDLVHADLARSFGRCDHLSKVHTSFLLAYFFEHFPIVALVSWTFLASANRSQAERWFGSSSDVTWYEVCDVAKNFIPRPYSSVTPRVVGIGQCLLPTCFFVCAASGNNPIARGVVNSALIALPRWLPFLNNDANGVSIYRTDRFARQLSFDQGAPGVAPPVPTFVAS